MGKATTTGFMAYQSLLVFWRQIHFYVNNQFYLKQSSLTWVHSLIVKNIYISTYSVYSVIYNNSV